MNDQDWVHIPPNGVANGLVAVLALYVGIIIGAAAVWLTFQVMT